MTRNYNVDTDIVFAMMKALIESDFGKVLLVSGDGDYKKVVDYFVSKERFLKILFPNKRKASSLYRKLGSEFYDKLASVKNKIEYKKTQKKAP